MVRFLVSTLVHLVAGAIGLLVAAWLLDGLELDASGFLIAVAIFTVTTALFHPFIRQHAVKRMQALLGATALITTFVGLLVTTIVSDSLSINGLDTWLLGTLVVWLVSLVAALLLPVLLAKWGIEAARDEPKS